jgi:hypothetical protein
MLNVLVFNVSIYFISIQAKFVTSGGSGQWVNKSVAVKSISINSERDECVSFVLEAELSLCHFLKRSLLLVYWVCSFFFLSFFF